MRSSIHNVLCSNVDDVTADGAGGVEGQGLVLLDGEDVEFALVNGPLVDGVGHRGINQLTAQKPGEKES